MPVHAYPIFKDPEKNHPFHFIQPPMFWRRWVWEKTAGLNAEFHWVMDIEWCTRAVQHGAVVGTSRTLFAKFRLHGASKTELFNHKQHQEWADFYKSLAGRPEYRRFPLWLAEQKARAVALAIEGDLAKADGRWLRGAAQRAWSRARRALLRPFKTAPVLGVGREQVDESTAGAGTARPEMP